MTGGELRTADLAGHTFTGVSVDSRTIGEGELFFAIRGENNDGHRYIEQALARGAAGVVAESDFFTGRPLPSQAAVVDVPNSHLAMLSLAQQYLATLDALRLGITGSNGKTTTKEFTYRLLKAVDDNVYRSPGNFNNLFGIPLALFEMPTDTSTAILEMGISVPGEMKRLAALIQPHLLAVTNVGPTHLEFLGTVENVAREKLSAMSFADPDAALIINADDPVLMAETAKVSDAYITFAIDHDADYRPDAVETTDDGAARVVIEGHPFRLPLFGQYQVYNLLAAYAIARTAGHTFDDIDTEAIALSTAAMRGEILMLAGVTFVSDCYNANPEAVKAGLRSFAKFESRGRRVIVLGDMLELGPDSVRYHAEIGELVAAQKFDLLAAVGPLAYHIIEAVEAAGKLSGKLRHFNDSETCAEYLRGYLGVGDLVYLKGSRGIGLETVLDQFRQEREAN